MALGLVTPLLVSSLLELIGSDEGALNWKGGLLAGALIVEMLTETVADNKSWVPTF